MSLLTDLEKMDTDLKQVRTDTNVALTEKGGTEVQNLNEIAEAIRSITGGGSGRVVISDIVVDRQIANGEQLLNYILELSLEKRPKFIAFISKKFFTADTFNENEIVNVIRGFIDGVPMDMSFGWRLRNGSISNFPIGFPAYDAKINIGQEFTLYEVIG